MSRGALNNDPQRALPPRSLEVSPELAAVAPDSRRRRGSSFRAFADCHRLGFRTYWLAVVTIGCALAASGLRGASGRVLVGPHPIAFWMFATALFVAELKPLSLPRREGGGEITVSWAFSFALLLTTSPAGAALTVLVATAVADLLHRKHLSRVLFNATQIAICVYAAAGVFEILTPAGATVPVGGPSLVWIGAATIAAIVAFTLNGVLTTVVIALATDNPVGATLRAGLLTNLSTDGTLLALAPVLVVVAVHSPLLMPTLLAAAYAVYRSTFLALARKHEAELDALTGLANRRSFDGAVEAAQASVGKLDKRLAVILIDLDGFKAINDRLGHHVGDQVLKQVGSRLSSMSRVGDIAARIGGDEFAILARVTGQDEAMAIANRVMLLFREPCQVEGFPVAVGGSAGVAVYPDHGDTVEELLHEADAAMYQAKQKRLHVAAPKKRSGFSGSRLSLLSDLPGALEHHQLFLHYQPKVEIVSGQLVGVEALVRWRHPRFGLLSPDAFVPLAEQTELMAPFTGYVLDLALRQCAAWSEAGFSIPVAVNGSARNLHDVRFPHEVARLLNETGVDPALLEVEITENTVMANPSTAAIVLATLRDVGVRLSVDDFGTGYSSLTALRDLPIDRIKIDKSFVSSITAQQGDAVIVRSIVELAHNLGLETIAEGVEDSATLDLLGHMGCTTAQGYLIARPSPVEVITPWIKSHAGRLATRVSSARV